jgi:hypothetical protein
MSIFKRAAAFFVMLPCLAVLAVVGKRLVGDIAGFFSLRLSCKDRLACSADDGSRVVFVQRAGTHCGD